MLFEAAELAQAAECSPSIHEALGLIFTINRVWTEVPGHPQLHSDFEASLSYTRY